MPRNWSWGKKRKSGYRSGAEEKLAETLTESGVGFTYESLTLEYEKPVRKGKCKECNGKKVVKVATYKPDFVLDNGRVIEYKGRLTAADRSKLIAVRNSNPTVKIHLLFGSDNKLQKNGTKRYSEWATEHGFDYAIGSPPRRWLSKRSAT
jgi:Phage endonuclease I